MSQALSNVFKLKDIINVKDPAFGAKGDGVTDDTAAIQAALTAANVSAGADGQNKTVFLPSGTYQISGQLIIPYAVSLKGSGARSTRIRVASSFAALSATGAIRIGNGTAASFGSMVEDLMVECNNLAGSVGVYSSDAQDQSGCRNVLVNNFLGYGLRFNGAGGTFGSINMFICEHCEALKSNGGGTSGIGFSFENGTFSANIHSNTAFGPSGNPLQHGFNAENFSLIGSGFTCDGGGTNGVLLGTNVFVASLHGITSLGYTNTVNITSTGNICLSSIRRASGGTNTINDAGNSGIAKTITVTDVPSYVRGTNKSVNDGIDAYARIAVQGGVQTTLLIDKTGAIGTGRMRIDVGDGTGGSVADDNYIRALNTDLHWMAGASANTERMRLTNGGLLRLFSGQFYPATDALAGQTVCGLFAGNGVPNNANGNNGDFYLRGDGTQAGSTVIYHKEAGVWVALVTT